MVAAETTAALVGAVASASATAITTALANYDAGAGDMKASIENETFRKWKLWDTGNPDGTPKPGMSRDLDGIPLAQTMYEAWKMSGEVPEGIGELPDDVDDIPVAVDVLLSRWVNKEPFTGSFTDTCFIEGGGDFVTYVAVYHDENKTHAIAIVLRDPRVGKKWCAAICHSVDWMKKNMKGDGWGQRLVDHADDHHENHSHTVKVHEGEKQTAKYGIFSCQVTCGRESHFLIENT